MNVAKRAREKTETPMADTEASPLTGGFGFSHSAYSQGRDQHSQLANTSMSPASVEVPNLTGKIGFKNGICFEHTLLFLLFPIQYNITTIYIAFTVF